jgi:hypothetical protein
MTKLHQRGPRAPQRLTRVIAAAFALAMSFVLVDRASATTYTWTGDANSGLWNAKSGIFTTNWAGNVIPISAATNEIVFSNSSSNFPAAQDIANPFLLNRLTFGGQQFTITGSPLQFSANGAVNPSIVQNTALLQTIDNNLVLAADTTLS